MSRATNKGFTLIELMLAMTFISLLLLAIAMTIIQIANIYNKGTILREINQVSRDVNNEIERAMRASGSFSLEPSAQRYVNNTVGGRLCLGQFTYVWNYGEALGNNDSELNVYTDGSPLVFVKVPDSGANYCSLNTVTNNYPAIDRDTATELIQSGDHSLVLHKFTVSSSPSATDTLSGQQLYRVVYIVGTSDVAALNDDRDSCKPPNVAGADFNYCSVQDFTLVLRVANGVN